MNELRAEARCFLDARLPGSRAQLLDPDASTRRFYRVWTPDGGTRVLMDYGAPFVEPSDDQRRSEVFDRAGLRVARVLGADGAAGCILLEDLGDRLLETVLQGSLATDGALPVLERAVRLAAAIAERGSVALEAAVGAGGPALDAARFRFEMDFFLEHFAAPRAGSGAALPSLRVALYDLADRAADTPERVLCHRDFHSRNLLVLDDGSLAMVDIQDARWGPDAYDVASLLHDPYVGLPEDWIDPLLVQFREARPGLRAPDDFRRRFDLVAAQRVLKALGTFGYQVDALGRERYRSAIPRGLARLARLLPRRAETEGVHGGLREARLL